jgi:hypothetical protein
MKIRDLYDIFFLTEQIHHEKDCLREMKKLFLEFKKPIDEQDLKTIILEGIVPSSSDMMTYLKRKWENKNI